MIRIPKRNKTCTYDIKHIRHVIRITFLAKDTVVLKRCFACVLDNHRSEHAKTIDHVNNVRE